MGEWWGTPQNLLLAFIDELWKTQKNQTFEKWKDMLYISLSYHIILHMRTENDIHMRYSSWDMKWDIIFSHFRPFFVLLPDYWPRKLKFGKRCRKHVEILSFYTCVLLIKAIGMYDVWFLRYEVQQMERFCHCGKLFALLSLPPPSPFLPPNNPQNKNLRENEKNTLRYHHLTQLYQKSWSYAILFLRYRAWCMLFPFTPPSPLTSPKMKNSKQWKKPGDINLH